MLLDSYSEINQDLSISLNDVRHEVGQVFSSPISAILSRATFYLAKEQSPSGNAVAKLYNISGTPGTNAVPSGAALATSSTSIDVSTLTVWPIFALIDFYFVPPGPTLIAGINYAIVVAYTNGDQTNTLVAGQDSSSPSHAGNRVLLVDPDWEAAQDRDIVFYLYGNLRPSLNGTPWWMTI